MVDVREGHEVEGGGLPTIPGAINLPVRQLPQAWEQLEAYRDRHIVCVCRAGVRSATATALLHGLGFERVSNLSGGLLALASPPSLDDPRLESVPAVEPAQLRAMVERGERVRGAARTWRGGVGGCP